MKRGAWLFVLVLLLLLPLVAPFDRQISDWLRADAHQQLANEILGRVFAVSLFLNILFILGGYANWKRLVAGFILPIVLSAVLTHTAKQLVGRARPDAGEGPAAFHETAWFVEHQTSQSFPSGHATTAAALAVLLGMYFPRFRYAFYLGAGCIALERVISSRHFLSDTLAGAGLGVIAVLICAKLLGARAYILRSTPARTGQGAWEKTAHRFGWSGPPCPLRQAEAPAPPIVSQLRTPETAASPAMDTGPAIQSDTAIQTGPAIQSDTAIRGRQSSALSSYKWPIVGLTLWMLAIAVSALFDQRLSDIAAAGLVHERLEWIVLIGGGIGGFAILPALLGSFPNRKRVMVGFVAALLLSTVVTHALKFVIGRARPLAGNGSALEAAPLSFQNLMDAFPSGHAAAGLTIAILLGLYYPHARAYFYLIAVCIMTERVVNGWHYPTDTLAGAAIAIAAVALCYRGLGGSYFRRDIPRPGH